ncbi:LytR/AlgR family response regulator transcription factor [Pedobacter kyonggii]|uniref:Response regulator n=1 Tax=Pedobacter kyonggii TaxID=1926871 RepID=A0A4Q9H7H5_9SPHI|nr:response regulator [Pedobacter kyonggii]TBO39785.1 response regulator [Pedobacter kyonggii]
MMRPESKYNCVIIDDDINSIQLLKEYVFALPELSVHATFSNPAAAIKEIKDRNKVDFLFLDIDMDISGLDIARMLREHVCFIVFVTGHPEHALEAFSVNADRYLVKPVSLQKFVMTVNELQSQHARLNA